jgi:hypothetical protein
MEADEKYECFRKHYEQYEEREQDYIVQIQKLMIKLSDKSKVISNEKQ